MEDIILREDGLAKIVMRKYADGGLSFIVYRKFAGNEEILLKPDEVRIIKQNLN